MPANVDTRSASSIVESKRQCVTVGSLTGGNPGMPGCQGIVEEKEMWDIVIYIRHLPPKGPWEVRPFTRKSSK